MLPDVVTLDVLLDLVSFDDLVTANQKLADYHLKAVPMPDGSFQIFSVFSDAPIAVVNDPKGTAGVSAPGRDDNERIAEGFANTAGEGDDVAVQTCEAKDKMVDSTSDQRTVNNVMRHGYRVLSDDEKANMQRVKDMGLEFWELIGSLGNSRELSLAKTKVEEAVMWAVKDITK